MFFTVKLNLRCQKAVKLFFTNRTDMFQFHELLREKLFNNLLSSQQRKSSELWFLMVMLGCKAACSCPATVCS